MRNKANSCCLLPKPNALRRHRGPCPVSTGRWGCGTKRLVKSAWLWCKIRCRVFKGNASKSGRGCAESTAPPWCRGGPGMPPGHRWRDGCKCRPNSDGGRGLLHTIRTSRIFLFPPLCLGEQLNGLCDAALVTVPVSDVPSRHSWMQACIVYVRRRNDRGGWKKRRACCRSRSG